jgi:hypothetical protein
MASLEAAREVLDGLEDLQELGSVSQQWEKTGKATAILPNYETRKGELR